MAKKKRKKKRRRPPDPAAKPAPPSRRRLRAPRDDRPPAAPERHLAPAAADPHPAVRPIVDQIEQMARASGLSPLILIEEWAGMVEATLKRWPDNTKALVLTGQVAPDPPEIAALFRRARNRYLQASARYPAVYRKMQEAFSRAFALLLASAEPGLAGYNHPDAPNPDVIGQVFVACLQPGPEWRVYFPGCWRSVLAEARQAIVDGPALVRERLVEAGLQARRAGEAVPLQPGHNYDQWLASVERYLEPLVLGPPLISSSAMMLAVAAQFPDWAVQSGQVLFHWEPADPLLATMARINSQLFSLNGYWLRHLEAWAEIAAVQAEDDPVASTVRFEPLDELARLSAPVEPPDGASFADRFRSRPGPDEPEGDR